MHRLKVCTAASFDIVGGVCGIIVAVMSPFATRLLPLLPHSVAFQMVSN